MNDVIGVPSVILFALKMIDLIWKRVLNGSTNKQFNCYKSKQMRRCHDMLMTRRREKMKQNQNLVKAVFGQLIRGNNRILEDISMH